MAIGDDGDNYAARLCNELIISEGGTAYGDWYLPSKYELNLMYENIGQGNALGLGNVGNFSSSSYWSSTESLTLTRGNRVSSMVVRPTPISSAHTTCVLFGLFSYLIIYQFSEAVSQTPFKKIRRGA